MYKIKLPNFEGPFDLLLYFIKRDEINIYDIPISKITQEFLEYIKIMKFFDLELAGEFILMAATLMYIKSQMLLPINKDENEEAVEDPRNNLVQKLIEYKKFKEAAIELKERLEPNRYIFYRSYFESDKLIKESVSNYKNATLFDLINAFKKALDRKKLNEISHEVEIINLSVDEKSKEIVKLIKNKKRIKFSDLIINLPKIHIVITFLALLELIKLKTIYVFQENDFDDIIIVEPSSLN